MHFPVIDAHVDVLSRMDAEGYSFYGQTELQAGAQRLNAGGVQCVVFALFVSPSLPADIQLASVRRQLDIFHHQVTHSGGVCAIDRIDDFDTIQSAPCLGGLLSLEGAGCLSGRTETLRELRSRGVRGIGLTWNARNDLADGCEVEQGGHLTSRGREIVAVAGQLGMWIDLSHLSYGAAYEVLLHATGPVMASHSNCRAVHTHRRNLPDELIQEVIRRSGCIGMTFEGSFVSSPEELSVEAVLRHVDHVLDLGGENCVGIGSDFDGLHIAVPGLQTAADFSGLRSAVEKRFSPEVARKFLGGNWGRFFRSVLNPSS